MSKVPQPLVNLYYASNLLYVTANVACLVIDIKEKKLIETPQDHLEHCFCKKIANITGIDVNLDHLYQVCEQTGSVNRQMIYKCPFGLYNIIVPVFKDDQLVAALQAGPILTQDPDEYLKEHVLPFWNISASAIQDLREELCSYPAGDTNYLVALSEMIAALITCQHPKLPPNKAQELQEDFSENKGCSKLIASILSFIAANYAEDITLSDAAKYAYVNPSHLSRVFNRDMNCNFRFYLNRIRIEKAKDLLKNSDMNIADICHQVGFTDQSYFNKIFKKSEHMTPLQYRKTHRNASG